MASPKNDSRSATPPRRRGELMVFLGAAPGVGKTFAVLGEARRRLERGDDVVIGFAETHGRARTAALVEGLEVVPRVRLEHREHEFEEMDVDAVLARDPEVAVVDELAHTNVPGSRNAKRWHDVVELLDAGIDVLTTVNVQHLDGLGEVVRGITGVPPQETVPDELVRNAEQVELIDITPQALRRRLAHGNVYPAHRIDAALGNYFRPDNLTKLRELALLWVADQVDVALRRYRSDKRITDTWETRERVVVGITGGPESEALIHRARRIAARAGGELLVALVSRGDGLASTTPQPSADFRRLAEQVGASFHPVVGDDIPTALLEFARGVNATQLVLGASRRSQLARLFDEGIGAKTVQRSGPIDVHLVSHEHTKGRLRAALARSPLSFSRRVAGWVLAALAPAVVALILALLGDRFDFPSQVVAFLLVSVFVAFTGGLGPSLLATGLSALLLDFFFTPPFHSFAIASTRNLVTLLAMTTVTVLVALVVERSARRAAQAAQARTEATLLFSYTRTALSDSQPLNRMLSKVRENFALDSAALLEKRDGEWTEVACAGNGSGEAGTVIEVTQEARLALHGRELSTQDREVLETAAGQALLAMRQQRMAAQVSQAQRREAASELRTTLLSAVGHDLRTPLTSIKAAVSSLRAADLRLSESDTDELQATVEESADQLIALVDNLLDSSRLATGAVEPQLQLVACDEVLGRALSGVDRRHEITVDVDDSLPLVRADPGLLERVLANVIENALRHGQLVPRRGVDVDGDGLIAPDEPTIAVRASAYGGQVEIRIVDHGPGLPKGTAETAFAPFHRLTRRLPGTGLGLAVAKGFAEAMDGTIQAEDTPGGGLTVVVSLPAGTAH